MTTGRRLTGMILVVLLMIMALCGCGGGEPQTFDVSTGEDGVITVTAENAAADSGGSSEFTFETDDQVIKVNAALEGESSVELIVTEQETGKLRTEAKITGETEETFQLPAGDYVIAFTAYEGATGTLTVTME